MKIHHSEHASRSSENSSVPAWIEEVQARGLSGALNLALNTLEPLGPLGAQMLYIAQPALGLFRLNRAAQDIAQALEAPGGIEALRQRLQDVDEETANVQAD